MGIVKITGTIELSETAMQAILAAHFNVDPKNVSICTKREIRGQGPVEYEALVCSARVTIPEDRLEAFINGNP